jgi:acyl carrier protein
MTPAPKRRWFSFSLRSALDSLTDCVKTRHEQAFERELKGRPLMDDETFYQSHYGGTYIPREIPIQLRRLFAAQLGDPWARVQPADKPADVYHDLDFAELVVDAQEEFGVSISINEMRELDGSFDSLAKVVAEKLGREQYDTNRHHDPRP